MCSRSVLVWDPLKVTVGDVSVDPGVGEISGGGKVLVVGVELVEVELVEVELVEVELVEVEPWYSYAPISNWAPLGLGFPSKSALNPLMVVPLSIAGLPA